MDRQEKKTIDVRVKEIEKKIAQSYQYQKRANKKINPDLLMPEKIETRSAAGIKAKSILFIFREGDYEKMPSDNYHLRTAKRIYSMFLTILPSGTYKALEQLMREKDMRVS